MLKCSIIGHRRCKSWLNQWNKEFPSSYLILIFENWMEILPNSLACEIRTKKAINRFCNNDLDWCGTLCCWDRCCSIFSGVFRIFILIYYPDSSQSNRPRIRFLIRDESSWKRTKLSSNAEHFHPNFSRYLKILPSLQLGRGTGEEFAKNRMKRWEARVGRQSCSSNRQRGVHSNYVQGRGRQQPSHLNLPQGGPFEGRRISRDNLKTRESEEDRSLESSQARLSRSNF